MEVSVESLRHAERQLADAQRTLASDRQRLEEERLRLNDDRHAMERERERMAHEHAQAMTASVQSEAVAHVTTEHAKIQAMREAQLVVDAAWQKQQSAWDDERNVINAQVMRLREQLTTAQHEIVKLKAELAKVRVCMCVRE